MNTVSAHTIQVVGELFGRVRELKVFLSSPSDEELQSIGRIGLDVTIQKSIGVPCSWAHPLGFTSGARAVLPLDTLRQLRKYRPDVVVSTECGLRSLQSALYCAQRIDCPLVLWVSLSDHTEAGRGHIRSVARRWLFGKAAAVFVNGRGGRRYVERLGCDPRKITEIYSYTINTNDFRCERVRRSSSRARRLLYVGRLVELKGLKPFVESLDNFCRSHPSVPVELSIAGAGPLERTLKMRRLGGRGAIRFLGAVPYGNLPAVYASADIFVLPTLSDEWGAVVNEAMAAGLPVLGSRYSQAVEELIEDGRTGWVFRPDDPGEVASKLREALTASEEQLAEMGTLASGRISELTPGAAADQMVGAIEQAVHSPAFQYA